MKQKQGPWMNGLRDAQVREYKTQIELALRVGSAQSTISLIEAGFMRPSRRLAVEICDFLNVGLLETFPLGVKP